MSRSSYLLRAGLAGACSCAAAFGLVAPALASPQNVPFRPYTVSKTLDHQCKWPIVAPTVISLQIDATRTPIEEATEAWDLTVTARLRAPLADSYSSVRELNSLEGQLTLPLEGWAQYSPTPSARKVQLEAARLPMPRTTDQEETRDLVFTGSIPSWSGGDSPFVRVGLTAPPAFNLVARDDAGAPLQLPPVPRDWNNEPRYETDQDDNTFNLVCRLNPATPGQTLDVWTADIARYNVAPTTPTGLAATTSDGKVDMSWNASTDPTGVVAGYRVYQDGGSVPVAEVKTTSATLPAPAIADDVIHTLTVTAFDEFGKESARSEAVEVQHDPVIVVTPQTPTSVIAVPGDGSVKLSWAASTDPDGTVARYRVYQDGATVAAQVIGTSATISGLESGRAYTFAVTALNDAGLESAKSPSVIATPKAPQPVVVKKSYTLTGSTLIKTLSRGTLPVKGGIDAELTVSTGAIEADLTLNPTSGRLTALGFLPVTAKIGFAPSGKTVGTLLDGQLETTSKVRIKVQEVKLFGAIPLAGGNNCQTKSLSEIKLKNSQEFFDYTVGGPIAGTYAISDLNGCGVLNGLVSPITAGAGNTLTLNLTPAPAQAN